MLLLLLFLKKNSNTITHRQFLSSGLRFLLLLLLYSSLL